MDTKTIARFWSKVDKRGPDECWEWTGGSVSAASRYGRLKVDGRLLLAHRVAFLYHNGWEPRVRHSCDNPPCCNPAHLLAGDQFSNMRDMLERGRAKTKLLEGDVIEIRRRRAAGEGLRAIAADFGIGVPNASLVANRRNWKHL